MTGEPTKPCGLRRVVTPTADWPSAPDAFAWTVWNPRPDGLVDRVHGFAPSRQAANAAAAHAEVFP